jgi:UrcA family protein
LQPDAATRQENTMKNLTPIVALTVIATSSLNIARADTLSGPRSQTVRFAGLDINHSPGAKILYRRLYTAAGDVCRELEPGRSLAMASLYRACVHAALSKAIADVGNPAVLAYASAHGTTVADSTVRIAQSK